MQNELQKSDLRQRVGGAIVGLAILLGIAGAGFLVGGAEAQTPTPTGTATASPTATPTRTASPTATPTRTGTASPAAPATGSGLMQDPGSYSVPLILLALVALGGGTALVFAGRNSRE